VNALELAGTGRQEEHVPASQEVLGAVGIDNGPESVFDETWKVSRVGKFA